MRVRVKYLFINIFFIVFYSSVFAENHETAYSKVKKNIKYINAAAKSYDINASYLASVIYTERVLNYDWTDELFDLVYIKAGQNGSLGFSQVKLKTAYFIESQYFDSTSIFCPGEKYKQRFSISTTPSMLVDKLLNDSTNIMYAAAYLRILQSYWAKAGYSIDTKPDIIGTLYSMGLFNKDGKVRTPHENPEPNYFGETVLKSIKLFQR